MTRRGRKRKIGLRHPGGDLVRVQFDLRALSGLQPHRVWLPQEQRLDQKGGSPLGCLNLLGVLSDAQYLAGVRYAVVVGQYRAVIETPRGHCSPCTATRATARAARWPTSITAAKAAS